jgi:hypothetical protein
MDIKGVYTAWQVILLLLPTLKGGAYAPDILMTIYFGEQHGAKRSKRKTRPTRGHVLKDVSCPHVSPSCLTCPPPTCLEEVPISQRIAIKNKLRHERDHNR